MTKRAIAVAGAACVAMLGPTTPGRGQDVNRAPVVIQEPDYAEPASLEEHVASAEIIAIGRLVRRLEPRVQTTRTQVRGKEIPYTQTFARYLFRIERVIKAPPKATFDGDQIVEQAAGTESLKAFTNGEPNLGDSQVLLFLKYYAVGQSYVIGPWNWQLRHTADDSVETVARLPAFLNEHAILRSGAGARSQGGWIAVLQEVEALVPRAQRR